MSTHRPPRPESPPLSPATRALIEGMACRHLRFLPRAATPRSMRSTLRLYEWATRRAHVVVRGERTGRLEVLPVDGDPERWRTACEREGDAAAWTVDK